MNNTEPITESNLDKAKRLILDNAAISGIDLPKDSFIFKMIELAATPDIPHRDPQGFLINTDVDDTMSKPLSDEEHECKYCHAMTTQPDSECYARPTLSDEEIEVVFNNNFDCYADLEVGTEGIEGIEEMGLSIQAMTLSTFTRVVNELHTNRPQAGWIDVKDRLPSVEDEYLIYNGELDDIQVSYYDMISWGYLASVIPNVTHWMKLPPKPKQ